MDVLTRLWFLNTSLNAQVCTYYKETEPEARITCKRGMIVLWVAAAMLL